MVKVLEKLVVVLKEYKLQKFNRKSRFRFFDNILMIKFWKIRI